MRFIIVSLAALCIPSFALAQPKKPEVTKIHVGFQAYTPNAKAEEQTVYKVGLWTPVYVELFGGATGIKTIGDNIPYIDIESVDSEDVGTSIKIPVGEVQPNESSTVIGYVKTGHLSRTSTEIKVTLHAFGAKFPPLATDQYSSLDIDAHLYLTLGNKIVDLQRAVRNLDRVGKGKEDDDLRFDPTQFRQAVFENDVKRLPEAWFGYNGVDLIILTTANKEFLKDLNNSPKRLKALAQWVRRGGRLVVPIAPGSQPIVVDLLKSPVWAPAIPVTPPRDGKGVPMRSVNLGDWGVPDHPFQRPEPKTQRIEVAALDPGRVPAGDWAVFADSGPEAGKKPHIAQVRYGLGQITYLAFSIEDNNFFQWQGKEKFLQTVITKLGPRAAGQDRERERMLKGDSTDLSTEMLGMLDNFDVKVIPFGYVALFIVLYILVVGPLDFVLLKYVFKRLEWTWITFPAVVLGVSVLAYFAAYALKGRDLKVNKIDIVDFDLRTDAKKPHAYGHSFFTLLSPRIQNYTIGVEPNPEFWGDKSDKVLSVDLMGWMGRPSGGPHDMGRASSSGFFRKPYTFREDAAALEGVPIPVWTTKAFSASWEQPLQSSPFDAALVYHDNHPQGVLISGKLDNNLAVDLVDAWLLYDDKCLHIAGGLKSVKNGARPAPISLNAGEPISTFANPRNVREEASEPRAWASDPSSLVKQLLFHERVDTQNQVRNHLLRPLDLGWRTFRQEEERGERRTREAILFARVRHVSGSAETVTADADRPLPTKLWLNDTPHAGKTRPTLIGQLNQDTYIRAILPVKPGD